MLGRCNGMHKPTPGCQDRAKVVSISTPGAFPTELREVSGWGRRAEGARPISTALNFILRKWLASSTWLRSFDVWSDCNTPMCCQVMYSFFCACAFKPPSSPHQNSVFERKKVQGCCFLVLVRSPSSGRACCAIVRRKPSRTVKLRSGKGR